MLKNLTILRRVAALNPRSIYVGGGIGILGALLLWVVLTPPSVQVISLKEQKAVQVLAVVGTVKAEQEFTIKAEVAGPLVQLSVREGDVVKAGQLLGRISSAEAESEVARFQAELAEKIANQEVREASVALRLVDEADALREFNRITKLIQQSASTQADLDRVQSNLTRAKENVRAAQAEAKLAAASVSVTEASKKSAQARLSRYSIVSPCDGQVLSTDVDEGQTLESNQVILKIGGAGPLEIEAEADEAYAGDLRRGMQVSIRAVGSSRIIQGVVKELLPSVNATTGVRRFRVTAPEGEPDLVPGRTVDLNVLVKEHDKALSLPRTALLDTMKSPAVMLMNAEGKITRQSVTFHEWPAAEVLITSGLKAGQMVIREPTELDDASERDSKTDAEED